MLTSKEKNTAESHFQKSNEYLKPTLVLVEAFLFHDTQGPPGLPGGVGQPGLVGEKVSKPLSSFSTYCKLYFVVKCSFFVRVRMGKQATQGRLGSRALQ